MMESSAAHAPARAASRWKRGDARFTPERWMHEMSMVEAAKLDIKQLEEWPG